LSGQKYFKKLQRKIEELIEEQKKREDEVLQPGKTSNNHDSYEYYLNSKAYKETKKIFIGNKKITRKS